MYVQPNTHVHTPGHLDTHVCIPGHPCMYIWTPMYATPKHPHMHTWTPMYTHLGYPHMHTWTPTYAHLNTHVCTLGHPCMHTYEKEIAVLLLFTQIQPHLSFLKYRVSLCNPGWCELAMWTIMPLPSDCCPFSCKSRILSNVGESLQEPDKEIHHGN